MKKLFLIPLMACMTCMAFAYNSVEKFYFGVTDGSVPAQQVAMSVYDGLYLHINVPADGLFKESKMDLHFRMNNVSSLGVEGLYTRDVEMELGFTGEANLQSKLSNVYGFSDPKRMVVSVKAAGATQSFLYDIAAYNNGEILASPNVPSEAMGAWHLLAKQFKVTAVAEAERGDYILVKKDSYIQLGGKKLSFTDDFKFDENFWEAHLDEFVSKTDVADGDENNIIYFAENSEMRLGLKNAKSEKNITINLKNGGSADFNLAAWQTADKADNFRAFGKLLNSLAGYVKDAPKACEITINFGGDAELDPDQAEEIESGEVLIRSGVTPGYYYTVCVPFGVTDIKGADFYVINQVKGSTLELISVDKLEGGKGYVCVPTANEITGTSDGNEKSLYEGADGNRGMFGTYQIMLVPGNGDNYVFGNETINPASSKCYIGANRAYIKMSIAQNLTPMSEQQAAGRVRRVVAIEQVATGMDEMPAELIGIQKVVVDGQLLIIRDGVKYNAQGVVVE